jgi:hypothetical protein
MGQNFTILHGLARRQFGPTKSDFEYTVYAAPPNPNQNIICATILTQSQVLLMLLGPTQTTVILFFIVIEKITKHLKQSINN